MGGGREGDENMRQCAERELKEECGEDFNVHFVGNAPMSWCWYPFPDEVAQATQCYGAKVFFFRAQLLHGEIELDSSELSDYAWATKSELLKLVEGSELTGFVGEAL